MALIVARDFTGRIADDIFEGAETMKEAEIKAKDIQEEIEFDFSTKLNDVAEERKEKEECIERQEEFEQRRATVSDHCILQFITGPNSDINTYDDRKITKDQLEELRNHEANDVQFVHEGADIDSSDDMDFNSDHEGYYNKYSICLPSQHVPYLKLKSFESPYHVFEKQTKDMSLKELAAHCDALLQTNVLQHDTHWVRFISQLAKQTVPKPKHRLAKQAVSKPNRHLRSAK